MAKHLFVTGKVSKFKNRDEVKEAIEKFGGKVTGSVTKSTFALINNDIESNSSKIKKQKNWVFRLLTKNS